VEGKDEGDVIRDEGEKRGGGGGGGGSGVYAGLLRGQKDWGCIGLGWGMRGVLCLE